VAGKEDDYAVVLFHLFRQFISENFKDVLPRGIVVEKGDGIESHFFESLLDRPGIIYGIFEDRPFVIGVDADNNGVAVIIEAVEGRGGPGGDLNPTLRFGGCVDGSRGQQ
jgi:hypothetical protein